MAANLYVKYKAVHDQDMVSLNPLSFILRKAEIGKDLTPAEWDWLEQKQLTDTIGIIKSQEANRDSLLMDIRRELIELRRNWLNSDIFRLPDVDSEIALILYKANSLEKLTSSDARFVISNYNRFREFSIIKQKYGVIEDIPFSDDTEKIFTKIDQQAELTAAELEWLIKHKVHSILNLRKIEFSDLQEKYKATCSDLNSDDTFLLWLILQKLDEGKLPSEEEKEYFRKNGFSETLAIAQRIEFAALKTKYRATDSQDDNPTHHLYKVLKKLEAGLPLLEPDINFLKKRNLHETVKLVYKTDADRLRHEIKKGYSLTLEDIEWCKKLHFEEIIFLSLKHEYEVEYRKDSPEGPLYVILQKLETGNRLSDEDVVWLEGENLFNKGVWNGKNKIYMAHHILEAKFSESEFSRTKNHWNLASASAHWRKAEKPDNALKLTDDLDVKLIKPAKLRSALLTTRGGALRDTRQLEAAEHCALEAIKHFPDSHNPYTLMGALCYDTGRYGEGDKWFEEAIKRGASPKDHDAEIKRILSRKKDQKLIDYLLQKDPHRFAWVRKYSTSAKT